MMPEMDGFEFLTQLRRREDCKTVPVIVITAKDLSEADRQRLNGQVARVIQKSAVTVEQLLAEEKTLLAHIVAAQTAGKATSPQVATVTRGALEAAGGVESRPSVSGA
ncbi:MAG: response regulator, partial [Verrucomicrobia bacterium]|nr:response regulator [Verrucomicrobiota bacterium]